MPLQQSCKRLVLQPLTAAAFAPFGQVLEIGSAPGRSVNEGRGHRFDAGVDPASLAGQTGLTLALYRLEASDLPLHIEVMERHPHSPQIFLPMGSASYVVLVAPQNGDGLPDMDGALAFLAAPHQGVMYHPDVWHHPLAACGAGGQFAMLMRENGDPQDCIEHRLAHPPWCFDA